VLVVHCAGSLIIEMFRKKNGEGGNLQAVQPGALALWPDLPFRRLTFSRAMAKRRNPTGRNAPERDFLLDAAWEQWDNMFLNVGPSLSIISPRIVSEPFLETLFMARKTKNGEVNKSAELRELLKQNPGITATEAVATLAQRGIKVNAGLFYFNKGRMKGKKGRRKKARQMVANVTATMSNNGAPPTKTSDVVATILKVKHLAADVGGLKKLRALVEALGE
jgi:hypothetical protein